MSKFIEFIVRFISHLPRVLIAIFLTALAMVVDHFVEPSGESWEFKPLAVQLCHISAIFVAGSIQRMRWRQVVVAIIFSAIVLSLDATIRFPTPFSFLLLVTWPALLMILLGIFEWYFTCRWSRSALGWITLTCLFGAMLFAMVNSYMRSAGWQLTLLDRYGEQQKVAFLLFWPLRAIIVWTAIPLGQRIASAGSRSTKAIAAVASIVMLAAYVGYFSWGVYALAARSLTTEGPFSRCAAVEFVAHRGRPSDDEMLWRSFCDGVEVDSIYSRDFKWRSKCFSVLAQHDPDWLAGRLSERLRASPSESLVVVSAPILAKHKRIECASALMRYALHDRDPCIRALEEMRVPQVAMALLARAEWEWEGRMSTVERSMRQLRPRPKGIAIRSEIRQRLTLVMGVDVGGQRDAWIELYDTKASELATPLAEADRNEVDSVVDSWNKWRDVAGRLAEVREVVAYDYANEQMSKEGLAVEMAAIDALIVSDANHQHPHFPEEGDDLFPAFLRFKQHYKDAEVIVIPHVLWSVPTTKALADEVDEFVRRVDALIKGLRAPSESDNLLRVPVLNAPRLASPAHPRRVEHTFGIRGRPPIIE